MKKAIYRVKVPRIGVVGDFYTLANAKERGERSSHGKVSWKKQTAQYDGKPKRDYWHSPDGVEIEKIDE